MMILFMPPVIWAEGGPEPKIEYLYYQVEVEKSEGARPGAGRPLNLILYKDSQTDWRIDYSFNSTRKYGNNCQVGSYEINSVCRITLPSYQAGDAYLASRLKIYEEGLRMHELRHCQIAAEYARRFDGWINSLRYYNCGTIMGSVRWQYNVFMKQCRAEQDEYDRVTDFGRLEGASLALLLPAETDSAFKQAGPEETGATPAIEPGQPSLPEPISNYYRDEKGVWRNDGP